LFKNFIKKNSKVLDFGCGNGALLSKLNINEKVGIENNQFSTKELNKKKIKNFVTLKNVKNNHFNLVFALSVIDHLEYPAKTIKELKKKLTRNGKLIIIIRQDSFNQNKLNSTYNEHLYSWSPLSFTKFLKNQGIFVIKYKYLRFTLPPKFNFLKNLFGKKFTILISKMYYFLSFKDRRIIFICKREK
ncbi:class I SAM-dependent methyltransferase, partial [Candidatus Pelagibacter sp.]|nr:class I SAM-dependent methyltransferase [Candidatus Pelagibacter sp.]